jgi:hypothetical protein
MASLVVCATACGQFEMSVDVEAAGVAQGVSSSDLNVAPREDAWGGSGAARVTLYPSYKNFSGVLSLEGWTGDGLRQDLDDPYLVTLVPVNADRAYRTNRLISEGYATLEFTETRWGLSAGRADVSRLFDTNRVAMEPRRQFLNGSFRRSTASEYPGGDDAPYTYAAWLTLDDPDLRAGQFGMGMKIGWALMDEASDDQANTMDGRPYYFTELRFLAGTKFCASLFGWQATYPHERWDGSGPKDSSMGLGISAYWEPSGTNDMVFFARSAVADQHVSPNVFKSSWSAGMQMSGRAWYRPQDTLGLAYGVSTFSENYVDSLGAAAPESAGESVAEVYYRFVAWERTEDMPSIEITPGIQAIEGAGGFDASATVMSLRIRSLYSF